MTGDAAEAARCWRDLDVSFYGHQLVFSILVNAFEAPAKADQLLQLIKRFAASGEVSQVPSQTLTRTSYSDQLLVHLFLHVLPMPRPRIRCSQDPGC